MSKASRRKGLDARTVRAKTTHPQVAVGGVPVDRGLAAFFRLLWPLGIKTTQSCEDHGGSDLVWVQFATEAGALRFFELVRRVVQVIEWRNVWISPAGQDDGGQPWSVVSLYFPREDLAQVCKALRAASGRERAARPRKSRGASARVLR